MRRIFWGGLLALLTACGGSGPEALSTTTFVFNINPAVGTVEVVPGSAVAAQQSPERVLEPGELVVASSKAVFLPGNVLSLELAFNNVSACTFSNLSFSRSAASSGVVSSREPAPADTTLAPGATTGALQFGVTHTGKPFTYAVQADADVTCAAGPSADLQVGLDEQFGDPVAQGQPVTYKANVKNNGSDAAEGVKLTLKVPFPVDEVPETCSRSGDTLTCELGKLAASATKSVLVTGRAAEVGQFSVTAKVTSSTPDPKSSNNSATKSFEVVVPAQTCSNPVVITDKTLEKAIRNALNKPTGDLSCDDLKSLTKLVADADVESEDAPDLIGSLGGLQFATNLVSLSLNDNSVSDLGPLSGLTKLTSLGLISNQVSDLKPLGGLTALTKLTLNYNRVSDLTPLRDLTNLTDLQLAVNSVGDVEPLRNLTKLDTLDLYFNEVESIGALVANTGLGYGDDFIDLGNNCLSAQGLQDARTLDARSSSNKVDFSSQGGEQCGP